MLRCSVADHRKHATDGTRYSFLQTTCLKLAEGSRAVANRAFVMLVARVEMVKPTVANPQSLVWFDTE